ncbi:MAG TPA: glutathione S-transferase [Burkholderiales bacterium]|nr:glutathione S-transferase [Burkholderiales bacterium]
MKLIGSLSSPFARKVRVVLAEKRIDHEFVIDAPSDPATRVPEFNPLGKIPVLVTEDGNKLFDSPVIVEYLDSISPVGRLIPEPIRQRVQVRRWEALADGMMDAAVLLVQEGRRPKEMQSESVIARQRGKIDRALAWGSADLSDKSWCAVEVYSLADIALGCALGFLDFRFKDIDCRGQYPNLLRHAEKLFDLPPFKATAPQG